MHTCEGGGKDKGGKGEGSGNEEGGRYGGREAGREGVRAARYVYGRHGVSS